MPRTCIVLLCGLPGSGKTLLARGVASSFVADDRASFSHVYYDELLPLEVEKQLLAECSLRRDDQEVTEWKKYRKEILKCVGKHLSQMSSTQNYCPEEPRYSVWKLYKETVYDIDLNRNLPEKDHVILIDDNMYYTSMRYEYLQLARQCEAGFAEIYVKCDVEEAIRRNKQRQQPVMEDVIITMAERFEPPNSEQNSWERLSIVWDNTSEDLYPLLELIRQALREPLSPVAVVEDLEQREISRVVCSTNLVHQADQVLRKLVAEKMAAAKGKDLKKAELRPLAERLNVSRSRVLESLRCGQLLVPQEFLHIKDAAKNRDSDIFRFMEVELLSGTTESLS